MNAHHQYLIELVYPRGYPVKWGVGSQGGPDLGAETTDPGDQLARFGSRLKVEDESVAAGTRERVHVLCRLIDHQMNIQRKLGPGSYGGDERGSEGDVGNEVTVHYIEM